MIPEFCIRRPVATILLAIGLVLAGIAGYRLLPVAALPQVDYPTISVSAQLAGASPDTMATAVATPLIKQFETIPGIDTITASSSLGTTRSCCSSTSAATSTPPPPTFRPRSPGPSGNCRTT